MRTILWVIGATIGAIVLFVGGLLLGMRYEQQQFELAKLASVIHAGDFLANGQPAKALSPLHFAKAFESLDGDTDGMLARAYFANGEPCLALAFAESHLRYMVRNKLTPLASYGKSIELRERASTKCNEARETNASRPTDRK